MLLATLAEHSRKQPEAPWLFYRRGLDWHWRSYRRVADQVARSLVGLRGALEMQADGAGDPSQMALAARQDPDALAAWLSLLAAGVLVEGPAHSAKTGTAGPLNQELPWLAECRGALDRFEPATLALDGAAPASSAARRLVLHLERDVEHVAALLAKPLAGLDRRPVLYAGDLAPADLAVLVGWSLKRRAAWALEPYPEAVLATALWTRPHVFVATPAELEALLAHWDRSAKRHSRLRAVVVVGSLEPGLRETAVELLRCSVLAWAKSDRGT